MLHKLSALARETHAVDDSFILHKAENARGRIPRLGLGRDRSNFHVTKSQGGESANGDAILVITSRNANGIFEGQAKCLHRFCGSRVKQFKQYAREEKIACVTQGVQCEFVGALGVEAEEVRTDDGYTFIFCYPVCSKNFLVSSILSFSTLPVDS